MEAPPEVSGLIAVNKTSSRGEGLIGSLTLNTGRADVELILAEEELG